MTEKKELIQQLKETDPDTYKKYRLEYIYFLISDMQKNTVLLYVGLYFILSRITASLFFLSFY